MLFDSSPVIRIFPLFHIPSKHQLTIRYLISIEKLDLTFIGDDGFDGGVEQDAKIILREVFALSFHVRIEVIDVDKLALEGNVLI